MRNMHSTFALTLMHRVLQCIGSIVCIGITRPGRMLERMKDYAKKNFPPCDDFHVLLEGDETTIRICEAIMLQCCTFYLTAVFK